MTREINERSKKLILTFGKRAMTFKLTPILQKIAELYQLPRDKGRFDTYLQMLQP